jgi:hypothetical protein
MAKLADRCFHCGKTILFGATESGGYTFCNSTCSSTAYRQISANEFYLSENYIQEMARKIHSSNCPQCKGPAPVDVHFSYSIWSAIVIYSIQNKSHICCRRCGRDKQIKDIFSSFLLGWWSPMGFCMTPVQIIRNSIALFKRDSFSQPSTSLYTVILQRSKLQIMQSNFNK